MAKQMNIRMKEEDNRLLELLCKHYRQNATWVLKEGMRRMFDQDVRPALIDKAITQALDEG